jgi:hypothetical protein
MTIILQYQFRHLKATKNSFEVELSFNNKPELIGVPYNAITSFSDPSADFKLIFNELFKLNEDEGFVKDKKGKIKNPNNLIDFTNLLKNKGKNV